MLNTTGLCITYTLETQHEAVVHYCLISTPQGKKSWALLCLHCSWTPLLSLGSSFLDLLHQYTDLMGSQGMHKWLLPACSKDRHCCGLSWAPTSEEWHQMFHLQQQATGSQSTEKVGLQVKAYLNIQPNTQSLLSFCEYPPQLEQTSIKRCPKNKPVPSSSYRWKPTTGYLWEARISWRTGEGFAQYHCKGDFTDAHLLRALEATNTHFVQRHRAGCCVTTSQMAQGEKSMRDSRYVAGPVVSLGSESSSSHEKPERAKVLSPST